MNDATFTHRLLRLASKAEQIRAQIDAIEETGAASEALRVAKTALVGLLTVIDDHCNFPANLA